MIMNEKYGYRAAPVVVVVMIDIFNLCCNNILYLQKFNLKHRPKVKLFLVYKS